MITVADNQRIEQLVHCAEIANQTERYDVNYEIRALIGEIYCGSIETGENFDRVKIDNIMDMLEPITENVALHAALDVIN